MYTPNQQSTENCAQDEIVKVHWSNGIKQSGLTNQDLAYTTHTKNSVTVQGILKATQSFRSLMAAGQPVGVITRRTHAHC